MGATVKQSSSTMQIIGSTAVSASCNFSESFFPVLLSKCDSFPLFPHGRSLYILSYIFINILYHIRKTNMFL